MKVAFIGVGNPIPTFIERRLAAMGKSGIQLVVVLEYGQTSEWVSASVVRRGGWSKMAFSDSLKFVFNFVIYFIDFCRLLDVRDNLPLLSRLKWSLKMLPLVQLHSPDLIHLQWISMGSDYDWLAKFYKCPIIASARGSQLTVYPFTRKGYQEKIKKSLDQLDYIHCVSDSMIQACKKLGAKPEKLFLNYNGIDTSEFSPLPTNLKQDDPFQLISVGSLIWRKGYYYQLLLLKQLLEEKKNVKLTIVGEGVDRDGLLYSAFLLGVTDHVFFAGALMPTEVLKLLRQSHVYISTSGAEGLSNSVLEAASCGLPVVAFECEGMSEIVEHGKSGFIIRFGDIDTMAEVIQNLLVDEYLLKSTGEASRVRVVNNFDIHNWSYKMVEFYRNVTK